MNGSTGLAGMLAAMVDSYQTNKRLKKVQTENLKNQGITYYQPSQIEAFFDASEPLGNMVFSGGLNSVRARGISRAIECALYQGYQPVVLHCSNQELEAQMSSCLGSGYLCAVNRNNPIYDPFLNLSNGEISWLILNTARNGYAVKPVGKYYIEGISDFIRAKGIRPYCQMYITCPYFTLLDKIKDAEARGIILPPTTRAILAQILQGQTERGSIEHFFMILSKQAGGILAAKPALQYAVNVNIAQQRGQVLSIDVQSGTNTLLIDLIVNEAQALLSRGNKLMLVADNIQPVSSGALQDLLKLSSANCSVVLSSDDVFASFGGEENVFFSFVGKCSKAVIFKHSSAYSCQKWSDYIGSYDKQEISSTYSQNMHYLGHWGAGSMHSASVQVKRENIVKPEEIHRLNTDEAYILDKATGELSWVTIV